MPKRKKRFITISLSLLGALLLLSSAALIVSARVNGMFLSLKTDAPSNRFQGFQCPLFLAAGSPGRISATIYNPAAEPVDYAVEIRSQGLRGAANDHITLTIAGRRTAKVAWTITPTQAQAHFVAVEADSSQDLALPGPFHDWPTSYQQGCGIFVLSDFHF